MTKQGCLRSEDGWVMVPVIILMVVAIGVGLALLTVVDQQTGQARAQRSTDSAQTLAEGVVNATANVLATDASSTMWPVSGACQTVKGDLTTASAASSTSLAARVTTEVQARFSGTSPDYASAGGKNTTWRVDVCPVVSTDTRWDDTMLTRVAAAPATTPSPASLWVRGQAGVRAGTAATPRPVNSRAVVSKVHQSSTVFAPPQGFAVGTGVFSTDISTTLNTALTSNTSLVGSIVSSTLGTDPLIAASSSKIGVRCGLLTTLDNPGTTCLAGSLAGVANVTNALGLGTLNTLLGIDRTQTLGTWTMAPSDAIETWRSEAKGTNTWFASVAGFGDDRTPSTVTGVSGTASPCFTGTPTNSQVIFIDKVGNGEQYCNIPAGTTAKIIVVERGAMRVTGAFTGVVYALNRQECSQSDGSCSKQDHEHAVTREVVRIDGNAGKVTGSAWADGAGGAVGIYPSLNPSGASNSSLLAVGGATGVCGLPVVGPVVSALNTTLAGVGALVGNLLGATLGPQEDVRYPNGATAPTGCDLLQAQLGTLTSSQVLSLYGSGGTQTVVTSEHRTRTCKTSLVVCITWNAWSGWSTRDTSTVTLPPLLQGASSSAVSQLGGLLAGTLTNYTAIQYDSATVARATAAVAHGAAPVVGTYRNLNSTP
jgi:hypothetical protein